MAQPSTSDENPAHDSDVRLMQRVANKDSRARGLVAMRLCPRIRRLTAGLLRHSAESEDAAQEAIVEVLRSAANYRGGGTLERWADRIAVRTALRLKRRTASDTSPIGSDPVLADNYEVFEQLPRPLTEYLATLPEAEREALFLKHALGYTVPEISEVLSIAQSTIKFRLVSGLKRVRKVIRRDLRIGVKGGKAS